MHTFLMLDEERLCGFSRMGFHVNYCVEFMNGECVWGACIYVAVSESLSIFIERVCVYKEEDLE